LIAVLILEKQRELFKTLLNNNESLSFLPISIKSNLLSYFYSWINSYFPKDKIFVVCEKGEELMVSNSCNGINEENIIVEPKRLSYSISIFYATMIIEKIIPDSRLLLCPVNFLFAENFKMSGVIFAISEMVLKEWIVVPSILIDSLNNFDYDGSNVIVGGKIVCNLKGVDFFEVETFLKHKENNKKKKIFGKSGKNLNMIFGKQSVIKEYFLKYSKEIVIKNLYNCLKYDSITWDDIVSQYNTVSLDVVDDDFFQEPNKFLTTFIDTKIYRMDSWQNFLARFAGVNENVISGEVMCENSRNIVCINYDSETIKVNSLKNSVIFKKNGNVVIESFNL